jgi:prepilin-type N-terminal cleavage/methylation domain-containing protein
MCSGSPSGFSLVETLIAVTITALAFTSAARLLMLAAAANQRARRATRATFLAAQKIEELQSLAFTVDHGEVLEDERLHPSSIDALERDVPGFCDYFENSGAALEQSEIRPAGTAFVRRWLIQPAAGAPDTIVLQVMVGRDAGPPDARITAMRRRTGS